MQHLFKCHFNIDQHGQALFQNMMLLWMSKTEEMGGALDVKHGAL